MRATAPLAALLLFAAGLSGCFGPEEVQPQDLDLGESNQTSGNNATLPTGEMSAGILETNKTEEGVGGVDHKHDYWKGETRIDLLKDRRFYIGPTPVYPEGEGTSAKSVRYIKLPCKTVEGSDACAPALVYEGAASVEFTASNPMLEPPAPHPNPPKLSLQYRSAADSDWVDAGDLTYGTPLVIEVGPLQTDMPHSVLSLWVFRVLTDQTASMYVDVTVTAVRGREVVDWPGHPDFYAETESRVVLQRSVTTKMSGVKEGYLYDSGGTWVAPDKLISHGTGGLVVIVNVTNVRTATGQAPTGFFLESHNATFIGPEIRFGDRWSDRDDTNDLRSYDFDVPVDVQGMDGPYQPTSRWGFRLMATFADIDLPTQPPPGVPRGIGLCPACFEYEISYDIVVIALKANEAQTAIG